MNVFIIVVSFALYIIVGLPEKPLFRGLFVADPLPEKPENLVVVVRSCNYVEVELWKYFFQFHDIPSLSKDDQIGSYLFYYGHPIGENKLLVPEYLLIKAKMALDNGIPEIEREVPVTTCPGCNSSLIQFAGSASGIAAASIVILTLQIPVPRRKNRCLRCGYKWKPGEN